MDPRRFPLGARLGGCALSLLLALAACTDRELPTAVPTRPGRPSMSFGGGSRAVSVSAGVSHTCALKTDRTVACWGDNGYGQTDARAGTFTQVSAGNFHTCAVQTDGIVACWGNNVEGQATPLDGTFTQVSAGGAHTCAVQTDGTVACWGFSRDGQTTVPPGTGTVTQVSAGGLHTCALKTDGTIACWGLNDLQADRRPRRHLHPGERGRTPHVRREDRRHRRLLGERRLWAAHGARRPRHRHPGKRGRRPHLRRADRRHRRLLGVQR